MSSPPALSLEDYDAIASAVMETERGRWFLAEYARRNRAADTGAVLEALAAVEARLSARSDVPPSGAQDAARRITNALEAAGRVRASLADADEPAAARAFGDLRMVEGDLREALRALGAPQTAALAAISAPLVEPDPAVAADEGVVAAAPAHGAEDIEDEAPEPAAEPPADEVEEVKVAAPLRPEAPAPVEAPLAASSVVTRPPPEPQTPKPVAIPASVAVSPSVPAPRPRPLLDRLSEAEKAILFA